MKLDDRITFVFPASFFDHAYGAKIRDFLLSLGFDVLFNDDMDNHKRYNEIDGNIVLLSMCVDEKEVYETLNYIFRSNIEDSVFNMRDVNGTIVPLLEKLETSDSKEKERDLLHQLDIEIMKTGQFVPLYHTRRAYLLRKPFKFMSHSRYEATLQFWKVEKP